MKKKKRIYKPVEFSPLERRILEIGQKEEVKGADAEVLRKLIDCMPWLLTVADYRFDPGVARATLVHALTADELQNAINRIKK